MSIQSEIQQANHIRRNLRVRYNEQAGIYQVYTVLHGQDILKWITVSIANAHWYLNHFGLQLELFNGTDYRIAGEKHG